MAANEEMTIDDLRRVLRDSAGEEEGVNLDGDIIDVEFAELGYDSIALLETGGYVERERGVSLDEESVTAAKTPRTFLAVVNDSLSNGSGP
ncbi:MAG TPA: acyl carrier protein [Pseudonocardiaceae bacterium]|jgi:act minimal PKS acyl carrier protein